MRIDVSHLTRYRFEAPALYGLYQLRLTPRSSAGQTIKAWDLAIEGGRLEAAFEDQHGNQVSLASLTPGEREIVVQARGQVDTVDRAGVLGPHDGIAPLWLFKRQTPFTNPGATLAGFIAEFQTPTNQNDIARLHDLSAAVRGRVRYDPGRTDVHTVAEEALSAGHGVCQDHTHIFVGAARALGFPSRYVSGYLLMTDGPTHEASHAWAEAHVEGLGWVGFDISNGISPDARYVRLASGLDYREAAPISGLVNGRDGALSVAVEVQQQ